MNFYFQEETEDRDKERLDRFLRRTYPGIRLSTLQRFIRLGKVHVDGKRVKDSSFRLWKGQKVLVKVPLSPAEVEKRYSRFTSVHRSIDIELKIIYEDEYMLALNKDAGIPVQPGKKTSNISVYNALLKSQKEFYLLHRLDKYTSGVLLVAKKYEFARKMSILFKEHSLEKFYLALIHGMITEERKIDFPLDDKSALTFVKPMDFFTGFTFVRVKIKTGRKHQIRRHLAMIGTPVVGDDVYGDRNKNTAFRKKFKLKGYFLHCEEIVFFHPFLKKKISIQVPLPHERTSVIEALKNY